MRRAAAGKARNTALVGWPVGARLIQYKESLQALSLLSFDWCYLIYVCSFSYFMDQASWNSWNLLSFIGHVTVSGAKYKNHTAEESPTLNIQQLILSEKNKGLYFPYLWGEERALRLGAVTTGQWPAANDSVNKPTSWNFKKNVKILKFRELFPGW